MSNADQLKYERMKEYLDKKPTPIRKRPAPKPITFPKPPTGITLMTPDEFLQSVPAPQPETQSLASLSPFASMQELRNFIGTCIGKAIYKALDTPEAEIISMGQAQFEAFCRSVLEDAE